MRYELMRPGQIQEAIVRHLPLLMPVGVIEYHGLQNPVGADALISQGLAHEIERQVECVVAPTIFYGFTGEWAGDEKLGEVHVDGDGIWWTWRKGRNLRNDAPLPRYGGHLGIEKNGADAILGRGCQRRQFRARAHYCGKNNLLMGRPPETGQGGEPINIANSFQQ